MNTNIDMKYRRNCLGIIRNVMAHKPMLALLYKLQVQNAESDIQISNVMAEMWESVLDR